MDYSRPEDFYSVYDRQRTYVRATVRSKHVREFGRNIWEPAGFRPGHRVLELGCGTGLFLAYCAGQGVTDFVGVEMDAKARDYMPPEIAAKVAEAGIDSWLDGWDGRPFDRIVLLDVLEHFTPGEGVGLLARLKPLLAEDGRIVARVPNIASPWGAQYQFGDLTHKAAYTPSSVLQVALAAGYDCLATRPYSRGSAFRRVAQAALEAVLDRVLTDPPPIWAANMVALLAKPSPP